MGWWVPGQIHPRVGGYQKLDSLDCFGLVGLIKIKDGLVEKKPTASKRFWISRAIHAIRNLALKVLVGRRKNVSGLVGPLKKLIGLVGPPVTPCNGGCGI